MIQEGYQKGPIVLRCLYKDIKVISTHPKHDGFVRYNNQGNHEEHLGGLPQKVQYSFKKKPAEPEMAWF